MFAAAFTTLMVLHRLWCLLFHRKAWGWGWQWNLTECYRCGEFW